MLEAGSWGRGPFGNPEDGGRPPLEVATRQRLGKTENDFKCAVVTVIFGVCNSGRLSKVLVFTFCKYSINPITNPNPVYRHSYHITLGVTPHPCTLNRTA
jgi:hypothetical protein